MNVFKVLVYVMFTSNLKLTLKCSPFVMIFLGGWVNT